MRAAVRLPFLYQFISARVKDPGLQMIESFEERRNFFAARAENARSMVFCALHNGSRIKFRYAQVIL